MEPPKTANDRVPDLRDSSAASIFTYGLLDLIRPLRPHYSADGATLHVGSTAAHYGERSARVLWGLGLPVNVGRLEEDFGVVERCYTGGGWYFDGSDGQLDDYIPFAMHFYALIWAALSPLEQKRVPGDAEGPQRPVCRGL